MNEKPLVSVLIPLYNKVDYFEETLQSVLNQSYENIEIIIVDDGSTDGSLAIAKRYVSDRIKVFEQQNKGASAARNQAFELSTGQFIQYLDADDILDKAKIEEQIKVLLDNDRCIALGQGFNMVIHRDGSKKLIKRNLLNKDYTEIKTFVSDDLKETVIIHFFLIPRRYIDLSGGWNERITIFDDRDFYLRLFPQATKIIYCPNSICYWRIPNSSNHLTWRTELPGLEGALIYFSNMESLLTSNAQNIDAIDKRILSCLYKKILCKSKKYDVIRQSLLSRCIKYDVLPDCSNNKLIKILKNFLGITITFNIIALRTSLSKK